MPNIDLEDVITSSLEDAVADPVEDATDDVEVAADPDPAPTEETPPEVTEEATDPSTNEVPSPGAKPEEEDEFAKKFGIPAKADSGRENRIPHSRVQKIVAKAEKEAIAKATKDLETKFAPQLSEAQAKVTDYEGRLGKVAQFEEIMVNSPQEHLGMLARIPAYKDFFDFVKSALDLQQNGGNAAPVAPVAETMPQPDQKLEDGTMVYSMDGLQKLLDWQAKNVEDRVTKNYESRLGEVTSQYAPILREREAAQHMAALVPQVQKQIDEARTWPQFNENEADIVKALNDDQALSLEGAYRKVVFPKIVSSRDTMRASILDEIRKTPGSTSSVPQRAATKPTQAPSGPRSLEDVIAESIAAAGSK